MVPHNILIQNKTKGVNKMNRENKKYYKILPESLKCKDFQYQEGLNVDTKLINGEECSNGLHFTDAKNILNFYLYGTMIADVEIPEDAVVYEFTNKWKADKIILKNIRPLWSPDVIKEMEAQGSDIHCYGEHVLRHATQSRQLEVVKYLIEQGADPHVYSNAIFRDAVECEFDEIIIYLLENVEYEQHTKDAAFQAAASRGNLEIVRYLVSNGANVHANDDYALHCAERYGHLHIVEYIKAQA
jgi:ankyrin repeat protein